MKHIYKVGDIIHNTDGNIGEIRDKGTSSIDAKTIPSYWVRYSKEVYPDECDRNTWESTIVGRVIDIKFKGIDFWSRPVYKVQDLNVYIGSLETLFPDKDIAPNDTTEEINAYFKENLEELVIFGNTFDEDHDPLGDTIKKEIKLNII